MLFDDAVEEEEHLLLLARVELLNKGEVVEADEVVLGPARVELLVRLVELVLLLIAVRGEVLFDDLVEGLARAVKVGLLGIELLEVVLVEALEGLDEERLDVVVEGLLCAAHLAKEVVEIPAGGLERFEGLAGRHEVRRGDVQRAPGIDVAIGRLDELPQVHLELLRPALQALHRRHEHRAVLEAFVYRPARQVGGVEHAAPPLCVRPLKRTQRGCRHRGDKEKSSKRGKRQARGKTQRQRRAVRSTARFRKKKGRVGGRQALFLVWFPVSVSDPRLSSFRYMF